MKKTAVTALKIAVSVGLYIYIFSKIDVAHLWEILKDASLTYFAAAVLVYGLVQASSAYRWYVTLRPLDIKLSFGRVLGYYFLGMFFNFVMPTAIGGDVFRVYYLNKETRRLSASTASVFIDRDIGMAGLVLVAAVVATYAGTSINGVPLSPIFASIMLIFLLANLAIFYRPSYNLLHRLLLLFRMKRADERVEHLFLSVNSFRGQWAVMVIALVVSIGVQVGCALVNLLAAKAISLSTANGWVDYLIFIPTIGLVTMVPVSVNGMGWREFAYIVLFQSVGATEPQAAALAFLWLGVTVLTSLPGGVIYVMKGGRGKETLPTDVIVDKAGAGGDENLTAISDAQHEEQPVGTA
jgi:hypothetical protein